MTQKIRPSQFILVYGPGAILEGKNGPRMIPDAGIGLFDPSRDFHPEDYRIDDKRMSEGLLDGAKIYRLPTNPELGHEQDIYRTKPFPVWQLCPNQNHGGGSLLHKEYECPVCRDSATRGGKNAVGFVMACRDGHLDEIHWFNQVHQGAACKSKTGSRRPRLGGESIIWRKRGGTLSSVELECPLCGMTKKFGDIYNKEWPCNGRHPQREHLRSSPSKNRCERKASVITRQASNLRLSVTKTLLSIRSTNTVLHQCLESEAVAGFMAASGSATDSKEGVLNMLRALHDKNLVGRYALEEFRKSDWNEIRQAMDASKLEGSSTESRRVPYHDLIMGEFYELVKSSVHGAPPQTAGKPKAKIIFEINPHEVKTVPAKKGTVFRITPVQTLRTVTVQKGFIRDVRESADQKGSTRDVPESDASKTPKPVLIDYHDQVSGRWFPGVEFFGEGIFVRLEENDGWVDCSKGERAARWLEGTENAGRYSELVFRDAENSRDELNPGFVWWHTLSHLLIRAIGEEAGYASASIRERVYFESDGGKCRGGILLYATQPGSEGTLGGLIGLVPHMKKILRAALENVVSCSGDPLCGEAEFRNGGYNGASCYACLMTSETSCEHRNMWLDRHVLEENMP